MNKNILEGKWGQLKGSIQKEWGKLTDDDMDKIGGDINKLKGKLQEAYGMTEKEVEEQLKKLKK